MNGKSKFPIIYCDISLKISKLDKNGVFNDNPPLYKNIYVSLMLVLGVKIYSTQLQLHDSSQFVEL